MTQHRENFRPLLGLPPVHSNDDELGFFIGMKNALAIEATAFIIVFVICATVINCSGILGVFLDANGNQAERIVR